MKIKVIAFCLVTIWLGSCKMGDHTKKKPDMTVDTLVYSYKTIRQKAANCEGKPDSGCTVVTIKYPEFSGQPALNNSIGLKLSTIFQKDKKPDTTVSDLVRDFLNDYNREHPGAKDTAIYSLHCYARIVRQDSSLIALQLGGIIFQGGVHPASFTGFINWNTKTRKEINLDAILNGGYQEKLTKIADTIFRRNEKLDLTASLADDYFFKDAEFSLPANYSFTPLGIRFFYNEYEIKPYAAGTTDLFIPYAKIKSLVKPNTVIAQYLK